MRFLSLVLCLLAARLPAQSRPTGLLVVAHGASSAWNARVRETVSQVRWDGPVAVAFLMGEESDSSGWDAAVARLVSAGAGGVVAVPLMVSSHGGHYREIRFLAGELAELPAELGHRHGNRREWRIPIWVTQALDGATEVGVVMRDRWSSLPARDQARPLLLVAHGPSSDAEAALWVRDLAAAAGVIGHPLPVSIGLLRDDAAPHVRAAAIDSIHATVRAVSAAKGDSVTVLPVLISSGRIDRATIPADLAGLPVRYLPAALTPHAALARWIERVALARVAVSQ